MPPTERKARTGELTPPGMVCWARSKSCWLRDMALSGIKDCWERGGAAGQSVDMQAIPMNFTAIACQSGANMREHGGTGTILAAAGWRGRHGFGTICAGF
ncbi:hypothetical protein Tamer19_09890 [Cupriavidus sp. TA19]|nr:hypothetical protein Tamer19_09890 [Cupriavidus sp. TA19]